MSTTLNLISNFLLENFIGMRRVLAAAPKDIVLDYSIFSVGFTVLALILVVEIARHKLDHYAIHKPLLKSILGACYSELSALGIVETFVFLLQKYATYDKESKYIFGQFHFMFFFVAIFNAFSTSLMAYISFRFSNHIWVQAEEVELDYYLGLRTEYEKVIKKLENIGMDIYKDDIYFANFEFKNFFRNLKLRCTNGNLISQYKKLVLPIRFHEMRLHFLVANQLPSNFRVSKYLKSCEQHTLMHFSHIGLFSWLGLMAGFTLLYYSLGLVEMRFFEKSNVLILVINYTLLGGCFLSVLLCYTILRKVKSVFNTIISARYINRPFDDDSTVGSDNQASIYSNGIPATIEFGTDSNQLELFWNSEPDLILHLVQTVQFYFCIVASFLFLFWDTKIIDDKTWYLATVLACSCFLCYCICLITTAIILPIYIMCTSLGQLTNKHRLAEAKAMHRLDIMKKKSAYRKEENRHRSKYVEKETKAQTAQQKTITTNFMNNKNAVGDVRSIEKVSITQSESCDPNFSDDERSAESKRFDKLSSMVLMSSSQLQKKFNDTSSLNTEKRRRLRKTKSEGVKDMMKLNDNPKDMFPRVQSSESLSALGARKENENRLNFPGRDRSLRKKSASSGVDFMRSQTNETKSKEEHNMKRISSSGALPTLMEDIPARSLGANEVTSIVLEEKPHESTKNKNQLTKVANTTQATSISSNVSYFDDNDTNLPEIRSPHKEKYETCAVEKVCHFFANKHYRVFSFAFGTLPCFFLVGMRIENLLLIDGQISVSTNTWNLNLAGSFALEFLWLTCFIVVSSAIILLFSFGPGAKLPKKSLLIISAVIDIILSGGMLGLLLFSEVQRCCDYPYGMNTGIGLLEPFTGIIFLRSFRFFLAKKIVKLWRKSNNKVKNKSPVLKRGSIFVTTAAIDVKEAVQTPKLHHEHKVDILEKTGTLLELWNYAVSVHPEVVSNYGEFSSEMLKVMLGLPIDATDKPNIFDDQNKSIPTSSNKENTPNDTSSEIKIDQHYSKLACSVKEVICAGKVGMPVKIIEENDSEQGTVHFNYDRTCMRKEERDVIAENFVAPNARLIRNLRRCEFRLLPTLEDWSIVDVAITNYEIILLKVNMDEDNFSAKYSCPLTDDAVQKKSCVYEALLATRGGKGLRLYDVAYGREIVGHVCIKDITSVKVERLLSISEKSISNRTPIDSDDGNSIAADVERGIQGIDWRCLQRFKSEFWKSEATIDFDENKRKAAWEGVDEDRVKITTCHESELYLRFFCDLEGFSHFEDDDRRSMKRNAIIWCQTILRISDPEILDSHCRDLVDVQDDGRLIHLIPRANHEDRSRRSPFISSIPRRSTINH